MSETIVAAMDDNDEKLSLFCKVSLIKIYRSIDSGENFNKRSKQWHTDIVKADTFFLQWD